MFSSETSVWFLNGRIGGLMERKNLLQNEKGIVFVVALLLLLVLTLIGISSINTTSFDNIISGNERLSNTAFYAAEAGIAVGVTQMPVTGSIAKTKIGPDTSFSANVNYLGDAHKFGTDTGWVYKRYQVMATGESTDATKKEIELQIRYGPIPIGTGY
jgi:Tfp pilus assembly protein PilX